MCSSDLSSTALASSALPFGGGAAPCSSSSRFCSWWEVTTASPLGVPFSSTCSSLSCSSFSSFSSPFSFPVLGPMASRGCSFEPLTDRLHHEADKRVTLREKAKQLLDAYEMCEHTFHPQINRSFSSTESGRAPIHLRARAIQQLRKVADGGTDFYWKVPEDTPTRTPLYLMCNDDNLAEHEEFFGGDIVFEEGEEGRRAL